MKTIIACTDFTKSSVNACKYAALLAQQLDCKLVLYNMMDVPPIHSNTGLYFIEYASQKNSNRDKADKLLNEIKKSFPKIKADYFLTFGNFKQELKDFVNSHQIEATVMGLEAKDKISKFIFGSHTTSIAGKINCPVIIVPSRYKMHKLSKILLAVDNTKKLLKTSLTDFEKFIKHSKANLNLLHIRTEDEILRPLTHTIKINGKSHSIEVSKAKNIQDGLKKYSTIKNVDLVCIISRKHSVFYDLFSESNTKKVAFATKVPVMCLHE